MVLTHEVENWECPPIHNAALFQITDHHLDAFPEAARLDKEPRSALLSRLHSAHILLWPLSP